MKMLQILGSGLVATVLMTGVAMADSGPHMGMMGGPDDSYRTMFKERYQMSQDMMMMLKDVMGIIKGMNHHPTAEEQERLGKMMDKLDKMMATQEDMMKKAKELHEKRMENWKEHHEMMDDDWYDDEDEDKDKSK